MKKTVLASASAIAIMLGGCSWIDSHMPGSSSQSSDQQYNSSQSSSSAQTPAVSGTSQKPAASTSQNASPRMDSDTSAIGPSSSAAGASTDQMGSTSSKSMSHHSMRSNRVKQAQQKLKDDGEYQGQVDGKLGPKTAEAVKQYQQKNGLKQTGRLDHNTLGKLGVNGTTGSGSSAPAADSSNSSAVPPTTANPPASQIPAH